MTMTLDRSAPVRSGEELPIDRLGEYLRTRQSDLPGFDGTLIVEQFPGGHSNLTYLLRTGEEEFVLRRPPFGNQVKSAHDMGREYRVLSKLCRIYPPAPRPFLFCNDESVIGSPFYIMERRKGTIIRRTLPRDFAATPATMRGLCNALVENLASLHSLDYRAAGLADLGKPDGYVQRQVNGWCDRYDKSRTDDVLEMDRVGAWLKSNIPAESGAALIHNDFKFDNLVFDPNDLSRVVAVLDWEMATLGDPLMDLGSTLGYWIEANDPKPLRDAAMGPTGLPGCMTRKELVANYLNRSGQTGDKIVFYYAFGLYKIAAIVQQIYARYRRGATADQRFAGMNAVVSAMSRQADNAIATGGV